MNISSVLWVYFSLILTSSVGFEIEATVSVRMVCAFLKNNELYYLHSNQLKSVPDRYHHLTYIAHYQNVISIASYSFITLKKGGEVEEMEDITKTTRILKII